MDHETLVRRLAAALAPESRTPRYERLSAALGRAIQCGELAPGAALPPEPELARRLGVSRQTVNQALTGLARRGLVTRRRGAGTFVAAPFVEQPLDGLYSFLRTLTAQGHVPGVRWLGSRLTVVAEASALLTGDADGLVFELSRLRLVDEAPFVLETICLPAVCAECLPLARLMTETVYDVLRDACGLAVSHAEETMQPVTVHQPDAALLGLTVGEAAFLVVRTGYVGERPVELRSSLIRGDRYRFRVRLEGSRLTVP